MGFIREPKDVDFSVSGRELTVAEHQEISEHIKLQKALRAKKAVMQQKKRMAKETLQSPAAPDALLVS